MVKIRFDSLSDPELVEICNSGAREDATAAFGLLYRRHRDYVTRVALRFSFDREIAADTLQETFLYLLRKFPPGGEGLFLTARLRSLLYPVAKNLTLTALKRRRRDERSAGFDPDRLPDPRTLGPPQDDLARILAGLSSAHREVLLLRFVDGMQLREIAEALEIPPGTVKSRLHFAIRQLRKRLGAQG
ncbi:MAG: sigma-70 family RNA polymerase sigma factor [Gammaproteobacteria bacterium]|nr:sigma-70 family RNA polymerase sigma factor [Gammaproteobacteria bacterium]